MPGAILEGEFSYTGMNSWVYSENIHRGKTTNRIRADCVGPLLTLYVNGYRLVQVVDSDFSSGDTGLAAATYQTGDIDILFDNLLVTQP